MDYTDDAGMFMFTVGQAIRMQATLDGPRSSIGGASASAAPTASAPAAAPASSPVSALGSSDT
jgi:hypothetical protein